MKNRYSEFHSPVDICKSEERKINREQRTIQKKMREIRVLEEKPLSELNSEEIEKIKKKPFYQNLAKLYDPEYLKHQEERKNEAIKKAKITEEFEREKKRAKKAEKQKRAEESRKKHQKIYEEFREQMKREEEYYREQKQRERERIRQENTENARRHQEEYRQKRERATLENEEEERIQRETENSVIGEYMVSYKKTKNLKKTFQMMSLKYHPDKNVGNEEWAKSRFQILSNWHQGMC